MIVDFHTHIFNSNVNINRADYLADSQFSLLYDNNKSKIIDHIQLLKSMDDQNIDYSVAMGFPWKKNRYCEEQNNYFKKVHEDSKGRILPFGTVPLEDINEISSWVKSIRDLGLHGIGETAFYREGLSKNNTKYLHKLLEAATRYSLPLCLHLNEPIGHSYPGKYDPQFSKLFSILSDFNNTKIIFAHWGGGLFFYELMPKVAEQFSNYYYDTAATPYLYDNKIYEIALNIMGPKKILLGTDYPLLNINRYIDPIKSTVTENSAADIMFNNAAKLLKLKIP